MRFFCIAAAAGLLSGCALFGPSGRQDYSGDFVIHRGYVHPAQPGMTIAELKAALGPDYSIEPISGPIRSVTTREGQELYHVRTKGVVALSDSDVIEEIIVTNRLFRTEEGLSPGSTAAEAFRLYGKPKNLRTSQLPGLRNTGLRVAWETAGGSPASDLRTAARVASISIVAR